MTRSVILAGGCFWCIEHDMRRAHGVISVTSGYSGGELENPTYEQHEGHREAILIEYVEVERRRDTEPSKVNVKDTETSYKKLLQYFIDHIDPTDAQGQFADRGRNYSPAIFYGNDEEKRTAENVIKELDESGVYEAPAVLEILPRTTFYKAEEYHQNYAEKNPTHYAMYRTGSGREEFVRTTCAIRDEKHIAWSE